MSEVKDALLKEADDVIGNAVWKYRIWFTLYWLLVVLTVLLPGLAAMGIFADPLTNKVLAGAGALSAAISNALKPHEYATAYDQGSMLAWKTRVSLLAGAIAAEAAAEELRRSIDLTTFKYSPGGGIQRQDAPSPPAGGPAS